jgi:hypothetical protein
VVKLTKRYSLKRSDSNAPTSAGVNHIPAICHVHAREASSQDRLIALEGKAVQGAPSRRTKTVRLHRERAVFVCNGQMPWLRG